MAKSGARAKGTTKKASKGRGKFTIVVGTDGSPPAVTALDAVVAFPWPRGSRVKAVVARGGDATRYLAGNISLALDAAVREAATDAARKLTKRWRDAEAVISQDGPIEALVAAARRADVTVVGSRLDSPLGPFVLGSVGRAVARESTRPVMIVKEKRRAFRSVVVGVDGSANSKRAAAFVARFEPPARGEVTLVRVVEPVRLSSSGLLPARARNLLMGEAKALENERVEKARREVDSLAQPLARAGWKVRIDVRLGAPLRDLLVAATRPRADLLVIGARGVGGVERLLLGSVAEAMLNRAPMSVLLVR